MPTCREVRGLIRLLGMARREPYPGDSSSWSLSWKAPDGLMLELHPAHRSLGGPARPAEAGNFTLPETIFSVSNAAQFSDASDDDLTDNQLTTPRKELTDGWIFIPCWMPARARRRKPVNRLRRVLPSGITGLHRWPRIILSGIDRGMV